MKQIDADKKKKKKTTEAKKDGIKKGKAKAELYCFGPTVTDVELLAESWHYMMRLLAGTGDVTESCRHKHPHVPITHTHTHIHAYTQASSTFIHQPPC